MKTKSRWVSWRMASALLALPLIGVEVPAFAAPLPAVSQPAGSATSSVGPSESSTTATLTPAQARQAITVANQYATTASNGTVSVRVSILAQQGLSVAQIQWVESSMTTFDQGLENGTVDPNPITNTPANDLSDSTSAALGISPMSTGGMGFGWYISNNPYFLTVSKWYGTEWILNAVASYDLVTFLTEYGVSLGIGAGILAFIPAGQLAALLTGLAGTGAGAAALLISNTNVGFGVYFDLAGGVIPFAVNPNDP